MDPRRKARGRKITTKKNEFAIPRKDIRLCPLLRKDQKKVLDQETRPSLRHRTLPVVRKLSGRVAGLTIRVVADQVRRTFEVTNLDEIVPVHVSRTDALSFLAQNPPRPEQELLEETRSRGTTLHGVNGTG